MFIHCIKPCVNRRCLPEDLAEGAELPLPGYLCTLSRVHIYQALKMEKVSVREARERLAHLLDTVASGEEVVIVRRGKPAARLTAVHKSRWKGFPDRGPLRASLPKARKSAADTVRKLRDEERA